MPKNLTEFLAMMDERLWFRMIVCFMPPLVIVKLVGYAGEDSLLNKVSTGVLLIGVAAYIFWGRLRSWTKPAEVDDFEDDVQANDAGERTVVSGADVSGQQQLEMLSELRGLCREVQGESVELIALELAVNPQLSFAEATRSAIARRRILEK